MKRYNIFGQIHKGLRALLYETALLLQHTDFANKQEGLASFAQLEILTDLFEKHADTEDSLVFSAISQYEPSVVDAFEQEHITDKALGLRLEELQQLYRHADTVTDKVKTGADLNIAFIEFMIFNLEHMAKEEDIINTILWRYYTDEELQGITHQIVSQSSPESMAAYSKWMIRGLNNTEISTWLKEVRNTAPEFVFRGLVSIAENELPVDRWQHIRATVTEGKMVA